MANIISDETIAHVGILAQLELSEEEREQQNVFREDVVTNGDMREQILLNAPEERDGMFVAPRTFE